MWAWIYANRTIILTLKEFSLGGREGVTGCASELGASSGQWTVGMQWSADRGHAVELHTRRLQSTELARGLAPGNVRKLRVELRPQRLGQVGSEEPSGREWRGRCSGHKPGHFPTCLLL